MRTMPAALLAMLLLAAASAAPADEVPAWTITLRPGDAIVGSALAQLRTRRTWASAFNETSGGFETALRKKAIGIPAPSCKMDFLILTIPFYYPETPKQASVSERRAIFDTFAAFRDGGKGTLTARVEAPAPIARTGPHGVELAACNLYFAFPLSVQVTAQ